MTEIIFLFILWCASFLAGWFIAARKYRKAMREAWVQPPTVPEIVGKVLERLREQGFPKADFPPQAAIPEPPKPGPGPTKEGWEHDFERGLKPHKILPNDREKFKTREKDTGVRYTKKGQPYIIRPDGKSRLIKKGDV